MFSKEFLQYLSNLEKPVEEQKNVKRTSTVVTNPLCYLVLKAQAVRQEI